MNCKKMPLVSIITPLYNAEEYFAQTCKSVFSQTYKKWEWIIVDDKSTDNSLSLVKEIQKDHRIKIICLKHNSGTAKARNVGLDEAKGDYIVFLDADDEWDCVFLEKQLHCINDFGPIVTAGYKRNFKGNISVFMPPTIIDEKSIYGGSPLSCLTTMYDFNIFKDVRFNEEIKINEDYLFWITLLKKGYTAFGNQEIIATYNIHSGSKNTGKFKLAWPTYRIYRRYCNFNIFKSVYYLLKITRYSIKKYKDKNKRKTIFYKIKKNYFEHKKRVFNYSLSSKYIGGEISILSNTCLAAVIYHQLNLKFMSPTINMYMSIPDFLIFVNNINDYLCGELEEYETTEFPIGILKAKNQKKYIKLYFNHYSSFYEAKAKWQQRKKRMIYKKMIVLLDLSICYKIDQDIIDAWNALKCPKMAFGCIKNFKEMKNYYYIDFGTENHETKLFQYYKKGMLYLNQVNFVKYMNEHFGNEAKKK